MSDLPPLLRIGIGASVLAATAWLTPGSVVFRSHRFIHKVIVPPRWHGRTYTLFIVGRRRWNQNFYKDGKPVSVEEFD